jgi:hypothetical protein
MTAPAIKIIISSTPLKKNADDINRDDFNGREDRQDAYGTSVISIQILKKGGFISIKNRYNHTVPAPDNTFNSNPDNIIDGLSDALRHYFKVDFDQPKNPLPEGFVSINGQLFKYNEEINNIYYGDQAYVRQGRIVEIDRAAGDALFGTFLFRNKTKTLDRIDFAQKESFVFTFNKCYGGKRSLAVQDGHLMLDGQILIEAEHSRIVGLSLPGLDRLSDMALKSTPFLRYLHAPDLASLGTHNFQYADQLADISLPKLETLGDFSLQEVSALTSFHAPSLIKMGKYCLTEAHSLRSLELPKLAELTANSLQCVNALVTVNLPSLVKMGRACFHFASSLISFEAPKLTTMDASCLRTSHALTHIDVPSLKVMGDYCFYIVPELKEFSASSLQLMGQACLSQADNLVRFDAPVLTEMDHVCLFDAKNLEVFNAPMLTKMGGMCLKRAPLKIKFKVYGRAMKRKLFSTAPKASLQNQCP